MLKSPGVVPSFKSVSNLPLGTTFPSSGGKEGNIANGEEVHAESGSFSSIGVGFFFRSLRGTLPFFHAGGKASAPSDRPKAQQVETSPHF